MSACATHPKTIRKYIEFVLSKQLQFANIQREEGGRPRDVAVGTKEPFCTPPAIDAAVPEAGGG